MLFNKKVLLKWTTALRSGKYDQSFNNLQNEYGFCCLGVACDLFIPEKDKKLSPKKLGSMLDGHYPHDQDNCPDWILTLMSNFKFQTGECLTDLNDSLGYSFNEIADLLELVYVHGALRE